MSSNYGGDLSRRRFLKLGASGVVVVVVAGVGAYLALQQPAPPPAPVATPTRTPTPTPTRPPAATPSPVPVAPKPTPKPSPKPTPTISPREKMMADAKKEGSAMLYSSFDVVTVETIAKGFMEKYPEIKVEFVRGRGGELVQRYSTEHHANKDKLDTFLGSGTYILDADQLGMTVPYNSPEAAAYPAKLKDSKGTWVAVQLSPQAIAYNTNILKGDDIPKTFWDLLKPRFKDKLGVYDPRPSPHALIISKREIIGEARWPEFVKGLNAQNPKVIRGTGQLMSLLKTGEIAAALWTYTGTTTVNIEQGAPIDYVRRKGTLISVPSIVWLNKYAPHPNAARLLFDYLISQDGQALINEMGKYVLLRPGLPAKMGVGLGTGEGVTADMVDFLWPFTLKEADDAVAEWKRLFEPTG